MASIARRVFNGSLMLALRLPAPPYSRKNAIIIETVGRRSGAVRRTPVGCVREDGKIIVVAEHGRKADYVRNALASEGRLRVFLDGRWSDARLRITDGDPEAYLAQMHPTHAGYVRKLGTDLRVIEITPEG